MSMRILVFGLPTSGKTTLATQLDLEFARRNKYCVHINGDAVRSRYNDWDFSHDGRINHAVRMREEADNYPNEYASILDFGCPLDKMRDIVDADYKIFMDTVKQSPYEDTNKMFEYPSWDSEYDFRIPTKDAPYYAEKIADMIVAGRRYPKFDNRKPTVLMLGRYQPWHKGHRALFERAVAKTGQVQISIRDTYNPEDPSNPFPLMEVGKRIHDDLEFEYRGQYNISFVPNIVNITYGRDVGYAIEKETFDADIESISATQIRKQME